MATSFSRVSSISLLQWGIHKFGVSEGCKPHRTLGIVGRIFATIAPIRLIYLVACLLTLLVSSATPCEDSCAADMANNEQTFIMIKPDGVARGLVGEIIKRFEAKVIFLWIFRTILDISLHIFH